MANSIALASRYAPMLDKVFKLASLTGDLESQNVKFDGVKTVKIMKIQVPKLGDYTRNSGFTSGDVVVEWQDWELTEDRGREFSVDAVDDAETLDMTFGAACGEFIRLSVAPEIDMYRFAKLAGTANISKATAKALATGADVVAALRGAINKMDEDEVPAEGRILYITPTLKGLIEDLDSTKSREVLSRFSKIVSVPSSRFVTKLKKNETTKEYTKDSTDGKNINFLVVHPSAVQATAKHTKLRIFLADGDDGTGANRNQDADSHKFQYRIVHDLNVYENKTAGIYLHTSTT